MRSMFWLVSLIAVSSLLYGGLTRTQAGDPDKDFFNGKNLDGWEGLMQYWSVKDGAIVGYTPEDPKHNTFLCSKKKYKDFELTFKIQLKNGLGNSGVQIRSEIIDPKKFIVKGPQCDIGEQYWGSLYGENFGGMMKEAPADLVKKVLKPNDFNDYYIKCVGKHVTIKLNSATTVDGDFPNMPDEGMIAWQLHSGFKSMQVAFKDIHFKNLSKGQAELKQPGMTATPAESLKVHKDFKAELLYSVPRDTQGSWVNMCVDPKGRLIVSDQYGPLYRVTVPPLDSKEAPVVEKLDLPLGGAHGLLWAFDSLYVMVNENVKIGGVAPAKGLHRVHSADGGDTFDQPQLLRTIQGAGGEHGCHAIIPGPDGKSLFVVCGDQAKMVSPLASSLVPKLWGEDLILPRLPDGNGFMSGVLGPGGCIYKIDPEGKNWELVSTGYRNPFDMAFNRHGDLFTYDADMEWDMNTPWYRPTRVCLATSGSEYGWRNGAGKWPPYYIDSLPAVYNVGPGSPTGVCFGYGAKFPAKYQDALIMCDWSYGKLYALHLTPEGSAYKGELEEMVIGTPLPLTDVVVNPKDGAVYFTIGGRKTQSGLYRLTYVGKEPTVPTNGGPDPGPLHALRRKLETLHHAIGPQAVEAAWPYLNHEDRFVRFAARTAIEHQDPQEWQARAIKETDPVSSINGLLALVRAIGLDPEHHPRKPGDLVPGRALEEPILKALERIDWDKLTDSQRLDLLRVYEVTCNRLGWPERSARARLIRRLDPHFPSNVREVNSELCQLLVYLEAPGVASKTLKLMASAPSQEEQMDYAKTLRHLASGWTPAERTEYFAWYLKASNYKGGSSFQGFLRLMKADAIATLGEKEKDYLRPVLDAQLPAKSSAVVKARPFVKKWQLDELTAIVEKGLTKRDFDRGRTLFGEAKCFSCHRYDNNGGAMGPDLTMAGGRFSVRDLLESIVDPSKEISDQYASVTITTTEGQVLTGVVINYNGDNMSLMTNMLDPGKLTSVSAKKVESVARSKISMMPAGLLDSFRADEILDLTAYLLSRGDRHDKMFQK